MNLPRRCARVISVLLLSLPVLDPVLAADATAAVEQLDAKVQAEEAIRAAKRLQNAYAQYLSEGLWNDVADLFTDDASAVFAPGAKPVNGKAALRTHFMRQAGRKAPGLGAGQLHTYLNYQPIVTLSADGTTVKGAWHEVALLGQYGKSAEWRGGIYENEYRLDDGVWKISRLQYFPQYSGAYADYGHKAPAAWNIPYHFDAAHVGLTIPSAALQTPALPLATGNAAERSALLKARIDRLSDETAVQNLQHSFAYYLDRKMYDDVAELFADSATFETDQRGLYRGTQHIRSALVALYGPTPLQNGELFDHINLGTVVTIAPGGQRAASRTSQLSQLGQNGVGAHWELGTYENSYVKENGAWKISALRYYPRMKTDYDLGWAANAQPASGVNATMGPDRTRTHTYQSYPSTNSVAFHYVHPVTGQAPRYPQHYVAPIDTVTWSSMRPSSGVNNAIAELQRQLDTEIAIDAVENLNSSYGYYIDESAWDDMAATFASQGSKEITGVGVYVGPERIREILNRRGPRDGRSPGFFTIHQLVQPVIHVADDGSYANARMHLFQSGGNADGSSGSWIGGIYENTAYYENGEWKFGRQDLHHLFNASYRNGWARVGPSAAPVADADSPTSGPAGRAFRGGGITQGLGGAASPNQFAQDYPPDREIRAKQYAFPEITVTAFHYKNPVSNREPAELLP